MASDGDRYERELVRLLRTDERYEVIRLSASGIGAGDDELPDIIAGNGQYLFVMDAKTRAVPDGERACYAPIENIEYLERYADAFGGEPLFAFRWKGTKEWYFEFPWGIETTETKIKWYHEQTLEFSTIEDLPGDFDWDAL